MPRRLALASCSFWPSGSGDHAGLAAALADRCVRADWVPWDEPQADWAEYDLVLLRETWDYPAKLGDFLEWVDLVSMLTVVANSAAVVRWNHHKGYLQQLAFGGVPTVPTSIVATAGTEAEAVLQAERMATVVMKPAVGMSGDGVGRAEQTTRP